MPQSQEKLENIQKLYPLKLSEAQPKKQGQQTIKEYVKVHKEKK